MKDPLNNYKTIGISQSFTSKKRCRSDTRDAIRYRYALKRRTVNKRRNPNARDAVRYRYARKRRTVNKRPIPDTHDAIRY